MGPSLLGLHFMAFLSVPSLTCSLISPPSSGPLLYTWIPLTFIYSTFKPLFLFPWPGQPLIFLYEFHLHFS